MAEVKRYYWLRLHDDFFGSKRIKKLRKLAGGDTFTIIYLKMQLLAMKTEGVLTWTGLEENIVEELALDLDEQVEDVKMTMAYLLGCGLAETDDNINYYFPYAVENTGSETASTQRKRDYRMRKKMGQCPTDVPTLSQTCRVEKEIEKEIEIEIDNSMAKETFIALPLEDGTDYLVTCEKVKIYSELYPSIDVEQELRSMKGWLLGNKNKRKTKQGIERFITAWLSKTHRMMTEKTKEEKPKGKPNLSVSTFDTEDFFSAASSRLDAYMDSFGGDSK